MSSYKIVKFLPSHEKGALEVLRHSFFRDEKVCQCVSILDDSPEVFCDPKYKCTKGSLELEALCTDTLKDNVSVVAVEVADENHVIGVAYNKIQVKTPPGEIGYFQQFAKENITDESALELVKFMIDTDAKLDLFEHFKIDCSLELMFLGVKSTHKGQGIGQALIRETINVARNYEGSPKPQIVNAIFSSRFSQKAGARAGMKVILEIPYTENSYKGRPYLEVTGPEHPFCTLSAIDLREDKS